MKFQPSKRSEESRKPTSRCRRCRKFSQGDYCETHKQLMAEAENKTGPSDQSYTSKSFPKLPIREPEERTVITITSDSQTPDGEEQTNNIENNIETDGMKELHSVLPTISASRTLTT